MDALAPLIPLIPALAALLIGVSHFGGLLNGKASEGTTFLIASTSIYISALLCLSLLWAGANNLLAGSYQAGTWLNAGNLTIPVNFLSTGVGIVLSTLFALLFVIIFRFSRNYLHSETGFHRFFMLLSLFAASIFMILLSGNIIGTFIGWELAGMCSFFLIAFAWHRDNASTNACLVFVTNRIGDASFILGAALCYLWLGTLDWNSINTADTRYT